MDYKYTDEINTEEFKLPESTKINHFLLKNLSSEAVKAIDFFASEGKLLYVHGFLGTGKRQFINYVSTFLNKDVIKLEYYCKASTVCDDILLSFIDVIEKNSLSKAVLHTAKITTLGVKFKQYVESIKKPFVIIIHSFDDIEEQNRGLVVETFASLGEEDNVKLVVSSRAMIQDVLGNLKVDKKIFLKALSKEIFQEFIKSNKVNGTDDAFNDFYKYSRGYYYYTALTIKIVQAMNISLNEFLSKYTMSGMSFDSFLGMTYVNLIPNTIRNFFWFLRSIRHGISVNALAVLELYDDFSIGYLKNNLMIYQEGEMLYVQDYFQQDIDISIPAKTEIRLHKYIINLYEKELKEALQAREIMISRQALRNEIEYHNKRIYELEHNTKITPEKPEQKSNSTSQANAQMSEEKVDLNKKRKNAKSLADEKKYTEAIEAYLKIIDEYKKDKDVVTEVRIDLAKLYYIVGDYDKAQHYYELAENYYEKKEEFINLNYLYYELACLYFSIYKRERAVETIKKVIYSVDTPQSLLVDSCVLLGNIYSEMKQMDEAYRYYTKALESIDENIPESTKSELYFKIALACDEKGDSASAVEYYNKCIKSGGDKSYIALSYSNLGACCFEDGKLDEAKTYFSKAYSFEKENNNYEGIYYTSSYLAKIYMEKKSSETLKYLLEAKQCAEFINDDYSIIEAAIALGDYYYNHKDMVEKALNEYMKAKKLAENHAGMVDINKIDERINDMKLRMKIEDFEVIEMRNGLRD